MASSDALFLSASRHCSARGRRIASDTTCCILASAHADAKRAAASPLSHGSSSPTEPGAHCGCVPLPLWLPRAARATAAPPPTGKPGMEKRGRWPSCCSSVSLLERPLAVGVALGFHLRAPPRTWSVPMGEPLSGGRRRRADCGRAEPCSAAAADSSHAVIAAGGGALRCSAGSMRVTTERLAGNDIGLPERLLLGVCVGVPSLALTCARARPSAREGKGRVATAR
eukprot:305163-Chlamydomonas_euryale.AAC.2